MSFIVARMAPMGWSVGSAVTAAMLMGATQQVVTAAAILAGQVSVFFFFILGSPFVRQSPMEPPRFTQTSV